MADPGIISSTALTAEGGRPDLEESVRHAVDTILHAMNLTGEALSDATAAVSDRIFDSAAGGTMVGEPATTFSWGGYFQAIGLLCLLLGALWFGVWLLRRFGKFNFIPKPGALPKGALSMEAQMPLGPKKGLMVVRFLNKRLLLGVTEHQICLLAEENAQDERPVKDFQGYMADADSAHGDSGGPSA